jgi:transposase
MPAEDTMRRFIGPERNQILMFTEINLNDFAPDGSPVRIIDELVERLDTSEIEKGYDLESVTGRNPIHPKTIIKIALFALQENRFSLRKMEDDTSSNIKYRWLTGNKTVDHSTMGYFLSSNAEKITDLMLQVILLSKEYDLIGFEILNIDTVKIRANASYKQFKNIDGLDKDINKIREKISEIIKNTCENKNLDEESEKAINQKQARLIKLQAAKDELSRRIEEAKTNDPDGKSSKDAQTEMKINVTDHDCEIMKQGNGEKNSAYAFTLSVDHVADIITNLMTQKTFNDAAALIPSILKSRENTGSVHDLINADSGFGSLSNLEWLSKNNQDALIPDRRLEVEKFGKTKKGKYDRSGFIYNDDENTYLCPEGYTLSKTGQYMAQDGRLKYIYANKSACMNCPNSEDCTKSEYRKVTRDHNAFVVEKMRESFSVFENQEIYKKRAHTSESPHGQIKHNLNFRMLHRCGRVKATMEMSLLLILHNFMKIGNFMNASLEVAV